MKKLAILSSLFFLALNSCSNEEIFNEEILPNYEKRISVNVEDFVSENGTRTSYVSSDLGYKFSWTEGDTLGIFPDNGYQTAFPISNGYGSNTAIFDGGKWALRSGATYAAYYPFVYEYKDKTKISVNYNGQIFDNNNPSSNLGLYDYMASAFTEVDAKGNANFIMMHLGSILELSLILPANATYTSLTLKAGNNVIPTKGNFDLTSSTPSFKATAIASSLTMNLKNFNGVAGETATFYMMVPPMDLSGDTLFVTLSSGSTSCSYSIESKNILASKLYNLTGTPKESTISGTIDEWLPVPPPYVTFHSEDYQIFMITKEVESLEYSVNDGPWSKLKQDGIIFGAKYGDLRLRGYNKYGTSPVNPAYAAKFSFFRDSKVSCSGDIRTLVDYQNYSTADCSKARFCYLFENCTVLTSAPKLPSMNLASECYFGMFYGCTSLAVAPMLPAELLAEECYRAMFYDCTSLSSTPTELPATSLASSCYNSMFHGCTSLQKAPDLPATSLASSCYDSMFYGCTSLQKAPDLPATTLVLNCYNSMFGECTHLYYIKMMATDIDASRCLDNWTYHVPATGTLVKNSAATWSDSGIVPSGWTVETADE